jgi:ketosteroid isomerase-like protein
MPLRLREREEHAVIATASNPSTTTSQARDLIGRYVELIAAQDLDGVVGLYAPDAHWEVHVPGWDTTADHSAAIEDFQYRFFVHNRDAFAVDGHQLVADGDAVALRWDLSWRDRQGGAHCVSFQSHFFQIRNGLIHRHQMYCAGVRAYDE